MVGNLRNDVSLRKDPHCAMFSLDDRKRGKYTFPADAFGKPPIAPTLIRLMGGSDVRGIALFQRKQRWIHYGGQLHLEFGGPVCVI